MGDHAVGVHIKDFGLTPTKTSILTPDDDKSTLNYTEFQSSFENVHSSKVKRVEGGETSCSFEQPLKPPWSTERPITWSYWINQRS